MPSTTRGSILISTANDIGEALVEKLGGVGYSPNEWKDKFNLCGIAPVDSAPALSVLSDSAGTGDERGSILIATADAIGAILNKKYNVLRGFKPKEWASACRKMKALEEGSVASASIASFSDGADDVPLKKCEITLPASLDGYNSVDVVSTGKNLFNLDRTEGSPDPTDIIISPRILDITKLFKGLRADNYFYAGYASYSISVGVLSVTTSNNLNYGIAFPVRVKGGATYCLSAILTGANMSVGCYDKDWNFISRIFGMVSDASISFSTPSNAEYITVVFGSSTLNVEGTVSNIQLEVGNTATAYTPYIAPSSYTANLGRTIYGGTPDIVNGTGTDEYEILTLAVADMNNSENYPGWRNCGVREIIGAEVSSSVTDGVSTVGQYWSYNTLGSNDILYLPRGQYNNMTQTDWKTNYPDLVIQFAIKKATPTDFTFTGQEINTRLGYNAFWSDCGDTAVEYYQAPTPYTRKTATGGIANFSDQRTDLPLTKAIANIAPSVAGKSAVNLARAGKNLFDKNSPNVVDGYINTSGTKFTSGANYKTFFFPVVKGATYTISRVAGHSFRVATSEVEPTNNALYISTTANHTGTEITVTPEANAKYIWVFFWALSNDGSTTPEEILSTVQVEVGSSASAYAPYQAPTTYTAELGETVYGGSVDFVSGEVKQVIKKKTVSSFIGTYGAVNNGYAYYIIDADTTHTVSAVNPAMMIANQLFTYGSSSRGNAPTWQYGGNDGNNQTHTFILPSEYDTLAKANNFLANLETPLEVTLTLATPTESAIPGRVISPIDGVNNYWNDAGGDTEIQYFEDET